MGMAASANDRTWKPMTIAASENSGGGRNKAAAWTSQLTAGVKAT